MPEQQEPFTHEDGGTTPPAVTPTKLSPAWLANLSLRVAAAPLAEPIEEWRSQPYADILTLLEFMRQPAVNATTQAFVALEPAEAAIVTDVATALLAAGPKRAKLIRALRDVLESDDAG